MNDFIAIDFETANECHSSVRSVGSTKYGRTWGVTTSAMRVGMPAMCRS